MSYAMTQRAALFHVRHVSRHLPRACLACSLGERELMAKPNHAGRRTPRKQTTIEIALDESEAASLQHATSTLRWLVAKTSRGWSHAAVDSAECERWAARLEAIYYEARDQLKGSRAAIVQVTEADAVLLRQFIALARRIEPGAFAELVNELGRIATAIEPPSRQRGLRRRRSALAEP
jgi:hypothetical protein